jgi:hypothetical protein
MQNILKFKYFLRKRKEVISLLYCKNYCFSEVKDSLFDQILKEKKEEINFLHSDDFEMYIAILNI